MFEVYIGINYALNVSIKTEYINAQVYPEEYISYIDDITTVIQEMRGIPITHNLVEQINLFIQNMTAEYMALYPNFILANPRSCK